jgi:hypothetical protein
MDNRVALIRRRVELESYYWIPLSFALQVYIQKRLKIVHKYLKLEVSLITFLTSGRVMTLKNVFENMYLQFCVTVLNRF